MKLKKKVEQSYSLSGQDKYADDIVLLVDMYRLESPEQDI